MPDFVTKDFESFRPFPADDQKTYGLMLRLHSTSAKRLQHFTTERQGLYMLSLLNGKVSEPLIIDKPDIRSLDIEMPRTGEDLDKWKERSKKAKEALKNVIKAEKIKS